MAGAAPIGAQYIERLLSPKQNRVRPWSAHSANTSRVRGASSLFMYEGQEGVGSRRPMPSREGERGEYGEKWFERRDKGFGSDLKAHLKV